MDRLTTNYSITLIKTVVERSTPSQGNLTGEYDLQQEQGIERSLRDLRAERENLVQISYEVEQELERQLQRLKEQDPRAQRANDESSKSKAIQKLASSESSPGSPQTPSASKQTTVVFQAEEPSLSPEADAEVSPKEAEKPADRSFRTEPTSETLQEEPSGSPQEKDEKIPGKAEESDGTLPSEPTNETLQVKEPTENPDDEDNDKRSPGEGEVSKDGPLPHEPTSESFQEEPTASAEDDKGSAGETKKSKDDTSQPQDSNPLAEASPGHSVADVDLEVQKAEPTEISPSPTSPKPHIEHPAANTPPPPLTGPPPHMVQELITRFNKLERTANDTMENMESQKKYIMDKILALKQS